MLLWNAVMVHAVGAGIITFWQALGLLVLSRILVGGFGGGRRHRGGNFWKEKWDNMSEEKKAAIKEKFRQRWESHFPDGPEGNEPSESK
jgi:hypothetical protein